MSVQVKDTYKTHEFLIKYNIVLFDIFKADVFANNTSNGNR